LNLLRYARRLVPRNINVITTTRPIFITARRKIIEIEEKVEDKVISVSGKQVQPDRAHRLACVPHDHKACPLCRLGLNVKYSDVLILEQFMRSDGTVLPSDVTGLCDEQQATIEYCVQQAHFSGLFPKNKPKGYDATSEVSGYKKFNRYWVSEQDMIERKLDIRPSSWFYIRRY